MGNEKKARKKSQGKGRGRRKSKASRDSSSDGDQDDLHFGRRAKRARTGRFGRTAGKQYPPEIRRMLGMANSLYVQGNIVEASKKLQDVVMQCSTIPEPYALLGLIYQDSGKYQRALVFYKLACTRDPKNLQNHQETARIANIVGDHASRLEALKIIARLRPCDLNVAIQRAKCLLQLNKPKQALDVYAKAAKRFPRKVDIYLDLAESVECANPPQHIFVHQALAFCMRRIVGKRYLEADVRDLADAFASRLREIKLERPKPRRLPPRSIPMPTRRTYHLTMKTTDLLVSKLMESHKRQEPQHETAVQVVEGVLAWLSACRRKARREGLVHAIVEDDDDDGDDDEDEDEDDDEDEVDSDSDLRFSNEDSEEENESESDGGGSSAEESESDEDEEDSLPMDCFTLEPAIRVRYGICQLHCGEKGKAARNFAFLADEDAEGPFGTMMLDVAKVYVEKDYLKEAVVFWRRVARSKHPQRRFASVQLGVAYAALGNHELAADAYGKVLKERPGHAASLVGMAEAAYWRGKAAVPQALEMLTPAMERMVNPSLAVEAAQSSRGDDDEAHEIMAFQKLQLLLQWATLSRMGDCVADFACVALPIVSTALGQIQQRQQHAIGEVASDQGSSAIAAGEANQTRTERRGEDNEEEPSDEEGQRSGTKSGADHSCKRPPWKPSPVPSLLPKRDWQAGLRGQVSSLAAMLTKPMDVVAQVGRHAIFWLAIELVRALKELGHSEDVGTVVTACMNQGNFLRGPERDDLQAVATRDSEVLLRSLPGGSPLLGPASRDPILRGALRPGEAVPEPDLDSNWGQYLPPPWRCVEERDDDGVLRRPGKGWRPFSGPALSGPRRSRLRPLRWPNNADCDESISAIVHALLSTPGNDAMWNLLQRVMMEKGADAGDGGHHAELVEALVNRHKDQPQGLLYRGHDAALWNRAKAALRLYSQVHALRPDEPLPIFCLGMQIIRMVTVMEGLMENDELCIIQALACVHRYSELRRSRRACCSGDGVATTSIPEGVIEQEITYNLGRAYHQVGLDDLAIEFYNRALRIEDERGKELRNWHGGKGVTTEAAINLCALYKKGGAQEMALNILRKYLVVG